MPIRKFPGPVILQDEGVIVGGDIDTINITGAGATASAVGSVATVNIPGGGGGASGDPYWDFVPVLLHFNGKTTNPGSNSNIPNMGYEKSVLWTISDVGGTMSLNTATPMEGLGDIAFTGATGNFLGPATGSPRFTIGVQDFCIDISVKTPTPNATMVLLDYLSAKPEIYTQAGKWNWYNGTSTIITAGTVAPSTRQNLRFARTSNVLYFFIDGTLITSVADATNYNQNNFIVGLSQAGVGAWTGNVDEFRLSIGVGRGIVNYTPTFPFPAFG